MMIRQAGGWAALGLALFLSAGAHAATTYSLSCEPRLGGAFTLTPTSFSFQITAAQTASAGGRRTLNSSLTVHFLPSKEYGTLQIALEDNESLKTCKLTESGGTIAATDNWNAMSTTSSKNKSAKNSGASSSGAETFEWTFNNVTVNSLGATGSDGSGASAGAAAVPSGSMQVTLGFQSFSFTAKQ